MNFVNLFCALSFICVIDYVKSARILGVFPYTSRSHSILGHALFAELAERGHEVYYLSPYPMKNPPKNYHDLLLTEKGLWEAFEEEIDASFEVTDLSPIFMFKEWAFNAEKLSKNVLIDPIVQKLLNDNTQKFDLIIVDLLFNEALLGFGPHFNAPMIAISTFGQIRYVNGAMHSPAPLSVIPHPMTSNLDVMTFSQRFENVMTNLIEDILLPIYHYPLQEGVYNKYFKTTQSFHTTLKESVSLALLNTHYTLNFPVPYLPNLIEIGGFHVKNETNPIPKDILEFMDSAEHGVVYFSLGGNLKPSLIQEQKKKDIHTALSKLKQKVLWKWDDDSLQVDSSKFMVRKWFPQDDILAHPKMKLFITHGGLLSCTESILRGVPVIGIPIFGDQMLNMARAEQQGWGIPITYTNLTEKALSWALEKVLKTDKFQKNVKLIAERFKDQPETPMQRAIFWTEYVIRHKGAEFMKTPSRHYNLIEYNNLDIYFILVSAVFLAIFIPIFVLWKIIRFFTKPKNVKHKKL